MKIRSITCFIHPGWPVDLARIDRAGEFIAAAQPAFLAAGYDVQTTRLATTPFPTWLPYRQMARADLGEAVHQMEGYAQARGFRYLSLGPALPDHLDSYACIPDLLAVSENAFFSGLLTTANGVSLPAVQACGQVIQRAAPLTPDGFTNLRFAALANVPPGTPFFPASYHTGEAPSFALATEAADLAVAAFGGADGLQERLLHGRQVLVEAIERHAQVLAEISERLAGDLGVAFGGIDFSLAQFPTADQSIGTAMEAIGAPMVGLHGSLAAAALLTEAVERARFPRCGFCGLFLPVLEDAILAERAAEGRLAVSDLLLYSAVCGTGLDTVPLPGDTPLADLQAVLLDLTVLAQRLDKPLTARLMPIPGKQAGDPTGFDFAFFANSRVMPLRADGLRHGLAGGETFSLRPRGAAQQA